MDRTKLDENSFEGLNLFLQDFSTPEEFRKYMQDNGFEYSDSSGCYRWIRTEIDSESMNSINCKQLTDHLKLWLQYQQIPGTSSNPLSQAGYNAFARWDQWFGAYVAGLGYIGEPASSSYGAQLYLNGSWVAPGTSAFPMTTGRFYQKAAEKTWSGGQVDTWGYVQAGQRILGVSTDMGFAYGTHSDSTLITLANLCRMLSWDPVQVNDIRSRFQAYWTHDKYEIPSWAIADFLNANFFPGDAVSIAEALRKHYGVLLRIVTRTEEVNGKVNKYGDDYLIVDYNPILQQLDYIKPQGGVGTLKLEDVVFSDNILFIYRSSHGN